MTRVTLRRLDKSFGGVQALAGLELEIADGELVTLLGPSGCGKSTTLRLIAGLDVFDGGAIEFDGSNVADLSVQRRNVGMVFQSYALFPHMNVARNVSFGLRARGVDSAEVERRVNDMLAVVQLDGLGERFPHQLSGGQMQRVALARTLVTNPAVLLLDEPFAALDADLRTQMRSFVRDLQQRLSVTTIFVTHDQTEAMELSDRVAVMEQGRVLQYDTPETIYHRPLTTKVAAMIGAPNLLGGLVVNGGDGLGLRLPFGTVPLKSGDHAPGDIVSVMIRPEAFALNPVAEARAHISSSAFLGQSIRYHVTVGEQIIQIDEKSTRRLGQDQPVTLSCSADDVWIFPSPDTPPIKAQHA